ncbi:bile acid:sodium symporter family protein [Lignipirellula cremea]|uniref:Sodium Bile acid symporter family protein n=1 Tax=Lignipirellula cremea TaxID=2528010 RepID=A0A518E055_9BACT|nr:bile acid:sodium symporter family protein [Lignipirellula cremea]QDU97467.1 Sodium Bile acid symporter family protein [Lignipirellula cremea]
MLERFLIVWLLLSSGLAYVWPAVFPSTVVDPFLASASYLWLLITVTMFCLGWMLPREEVREIGRRWPAVLGGTALQYLTMPALAAGACWLFGFEGDMLIGVVMVGCVPGAMASNVLTLLARGNTSYSVSLTTMATLASPLAVPLVMGLAMRWAAVEEKAIEPAFFWKLGLSLLNMVVLPVLAGYLLNLKFPQWEKTAHRLGSLVANVTILWVIAVVVASNRDQLSRVTLLLVAALLLVNLMGYLVGYLGGAAFRLPEPMRRALTLEIGMQNAGLGAQLALQMFPENTSVAIAPAFYTFACMLTGTALARFWALRSMAAEGPPDEDLPPEEPQPAS